jgi:hypothetical protein
VGFRTSLLKWICFQFIGFSIQILGGAAIAGMRKTCIVRRRRRRRRGVTCGKEQTSRFALSTPDGVHEECFFWGAGAWRKHGSGDGFFLSEKCGLEQGGVAVGDVAVLMGNDAMTPWTRQQGRAWAVDNLFW